MVFSYKFFSKLMGNAEEIVLNVYNHLILEKEDAVSTVESAIDF